MNFELTQYICFSLGKTIRKVNRYYDKNLQKHDITSTQLFVLSAILDKECIKFKELAGLVNIEGSTLSGVIDRMEKKDLVRRQVDNEDRRSVLICSTDKAREIGPEILETAAQIDESIKDRLSAGEYALFLEILDKIVD